jgi:hypothetical protein
MEQKKEFLMEHKSWTKPDILEMLSSNDKAVWRAVHALYRKQTPTEQESEQTHEKNNRGFNGVDAPILTSFAKQFEQRGWLSNKQTDLARKKLIKYANQLAAIANERMAA